MRRVLVASHGHVASGIKSAIKILVGNDEAVTAVDCYVDDTDFTPLLQGFIDGVGPDDEGIIFTDLLGGSVCNKVMTLMPEKRGIVHVTGFNLIAVIECLLSPDRLTPEKVDEIVAGCSLQMKCVSVEGESAEDVKDDEGDFFS